MKKNELEKTDKSERETRIRDAIKKAAFALMAEKGLDKVSMREIAEKVNVTKPVLYYYFKNKEDLCASIIEDHETVFRRQMEKVQQRAQGPEEVLYEGLLSHLNFFMKDPIHSKFVIQMISYTLDMDPKTIAPKKKGKTAYEMLAQVLAGEEKRGTLPAGSINDVVQLVSGLSAELMFSAYLNQHICRGARVGGVYNKETLARLVKIILLGIKQYYKEKK